MHAGRLLVPRFVGAARVAMLPLLVVGLAACATRPLSRPDIPSTDTPYVGVFTGKFEGDRPIYRFPTIVVLGSRSSVAEDE